MGETLTSTTQIAPKSIAPGSLAAWWLAARPKTLAAGVVPVMVGSACAHVAGGFSLWPAVSALFGAVWIQIGANFANDFFDYEKGADTDARVGPLRAAQAGLLTLRQLRVGVVVAFLFAALAGLYLTWVAGPTVIAIGACSLVAALAYTGGPFPLGYHGLGDLFVMIFFGFVAVCGTAFVQHGAVPHSAWVSSWSVGAMATAILVVNNVRDVPTDREVGKRTLPARFGRGFGVTEYAGLVLSSVGSLWFLRDDLLEPIWLLLPVPMLIPLTWLTLELLRKDGAALNRVLEQTAKCMTLWGVLLTLSLILGDGGL